MYSLMPTTSAVSDSRRRMISLAVAWRAACGLRLMSRRPLFNVELVPSTPMKELNDATSGSVRIAAASACCRSAIALYEMFCAASEMP